VRNRKILRQKAQDDVTLPAHGSFPGVILSEAKNPSLTIPV
jgi:hypothetical protein